MTFEIRIAGNEAAQEWDAIVSDSPQGTIFHQWDWLRLTEKHTQTTLFPIIGMKGNTPIGVFPLFFQRRGSVRMVFSPPPHAALFYLGPVLVEYESLKQEKKEINYIGFQNSVERFISDELKAQYISISLPPGFQDPRPFIWSGYSFEPQFDYVVDLSAGLDPLMRTLDKRGRQNLTQARKRGISVEIGEKKEYESVLDLMNVRYAQQAKNVTASRAYFLELYDRYHGNLKIFIARYENEIVSGCIDFHHRGVHFSWIGNPKPEKRISPSPNDLLIWESIIYAHESGCTHYITMNAAGDKRLHSYYASKFNPRLKVHFALKKYSYLAGLMGRGYSEILKPLRGRFTGLFGK